jgi:1-acyl-sn-glycerol-3-phosphate acyltransferase
MKTNPLISLTEKLVALTTKLLVRNKKISIKVNKPLKVANINKPVIIVANHRSKLDPFVIISYLPKELRSQLLPIRFMTANIYYFSWQRPLMYLMGCFPSHPHKNFRNFGVDGAVNSLNKGYSMLIFPEGKRTKQRIAAKKGVTTIAQSVEKPNFLLCHIDWESKEVELSFKLLGSSSTPEKLTPDQVMDAIYAL